ncbi:unnamed protein product [Prorocentrum cordatum]|uniref:Uncharacterized protein n=1 Tax=Prorocentrum cordatum TaxID=2364126 RepID=A0ABN9RL62_9DINO|nr:unnamed protein product [Polarella glacialis]
MFDFLRRCREIDMPGPCGQPAPAPTGPGWKDTRSQCADVSCPQAAGGARIWAHDPREGCADMCGGADMGAGPHADGLVLAGRAWWVSAGPRRLAVMVLHRMGCCSGFFTSSDLKHVLTALGHAPVAEAITALFLRAFRHPGESYIDYVALLDSALLRQQWLFEDRSCGAIFSASARVAARTDEAGSGFLPLEDLDSFLRDPVVVGLLMQEVPQDQRWRGPGEGMSEAAEQRPRALPAAGRGPARLPQPPRDPAEACLLLHVREPSGRRGVARRGGGAGDGGYE